MSNLHIRLLSRRTPPTTHHPGTIKVLATLKISVSGKNKKTKATPNIDHGHQALKDIMKQVVIFLTLSQYKNWL